MKGRDPGDEILRAMLRVSCVTPW